MKQLNINIVNISIVLVFLLGTVNSGYSQGQCFGATAPEMDFTSSGGNITRTIQHNCSGGTFSVGTYPNWLTSIPTISGNVITANAPAYSGEERNGNIVLLYNGTTAGGISIVQNKDQIPPPVCSVSANLDVTFNENGEEKTFPLTYTDCTTEAYNFNFTKTDGSALPGTVSINKDGTNEIKIELDRNDTQATQNISIIGTATTDSNKVIGGTLTLSCNLQTWYKDKDNDGYAEFSVNECSQPTPAAWYKLSVTGMGDCNDEDPAINPTTVWHSDTDGDNFPDAGVATQTGCDPPPSGTWTRTPEATDDVCPQQSAPSPGSSDGCDDDCDDAYLRVSGSNTQPPNPTDPFAELEFTFDENGGTAFAEVVIPNDCSAGYTTDFLQSFDSWATVTFETEILIKIVVGTFVSNNGSSSETTGSPVRVNGTQIGILSITQDGPPVIPSCDVSNLTVDGVNFSLGSDIHYGNNANTKSIQVILDPSGCTTGITFKDYNNPGGTPSWSGWLSFSPIGNNTFNFTTVNSTDGQSNTAYVGIYDSNDDFYGLFRIIQTSCAAVKWYPDQDNDGGGDATVSPRYGCTAPTDQSYVYRNNNWDLCPDESGIEDNQGCPQALSPENRNTITSLSYDLNNNLKVSSKSYFDEIGKLEQTQAWDIKSDSIWASATLYEEFGRPALQTLSAPIKEGSSFQFKEGFIKKDDNITDYDLEDFDGANKEEPEPVGNLDATPSGEDSATLGWYYSENNNREGFQDVTEYPFTKSIYSDLNPGGVLRSVGGNKINGEWPQPYTFSMKASGELSQNVAFGDINYNSIEINKTVTRDVRGVENVVFTDSDGKLLAAARSGSEGATSPSMSVAIPEQGFVDIHIAEGITGFSVSNATAVTVYDLLTEQSLSGATSGLTNGFYRVAVNDLDSYAPASISVSYTVNYYDYSLSEYDEADRLVKSYQPLGGTIGTKPFTTYEYNTLGQLLETISPDEGTTQFKYRNDGQIRFSQNSKQKDPDEDGNFSDGEFSYTNYDEYSRPVESGVFKEGSTTFANADNLLENTLEDITIDNDGLDDTDCSEQQFTLYDKTDTSALHTALDADGITRSQHYPVQRFVNGNVSKTYTVETGSSATTWYSYDVYGRVEWMAQQIEGLGTKTIDYEYDSVTGQIRKVYYQKYVPSELFIHWYGYNEGDQLVTVKTNTIDDDNSYTLHAEYEYYETGAMKRAELAGGIQGIDYVYNLAGQLKSINHPDLSMGDLHGDDIDQDLFGMQLDYHADDYKRNVPGMAPQTYGTDQLNGNIKGMRWKNDAVPGSTSELKYTYSYDRNNWLQSANFDGSGGGSGIGITSTAVTNNGQTLLLEDDTSITLADGFHAKAGSDVTIQIIGGNQILAGDYDVSNLTYDANGNIKSLKRNKNGGAGNAMDDLTYNYNTDYTQEGPNRLNQVIDADLDVSGADDIGTQTDPQNYVYNAIGQLIENKAEQLTYTYNASGLVTLIHRNNLNLVKYVYNDRNHRVRKETYGTNGALVTKTTHYVRDASGSVMAIYADNTLDEQPIYGNSRLGVAFNGSGNSKSYVYELTDHLGNVRATFSKSGSNTITENGSDYYPGGMAMPGRKLVGDYRYGFQGQFSEEDTETGLNSFEARLYDSKINRWLSPDPNQQFKSPYVGMGNYFVNGLDPDGRDVVLLYNEDAPFDTGIGGHSALLIGNDTDGWVFYNKNGGENADGSAIIEKRKFDNINDFYERANKNGSFQTGVHITTSSDVDAKMIKRAEDVMKSGNEYALCGLNCADFTRDVMSAGEFDLGRKQQFKSNFGNITLPRNELINAYNRTDGTMLFFQNKLDNTDFHEFRAYNMILYGNFARMEGLESRSRFLTNKKLTGTVEVGQGSFGKAY